MDTTTPTMSADRQSLNSEMLGSSVPPLQRRTPRADSDDNEYWRARLAQYPQETIDGALDQFIALMINNAAQRSAAEGKEPTRLDPARIKAVLMARPKQVVELIGDARKITQQIREKQREKEGEAGTSAEAGAKRRREAEAPLLARLERPNKMPPPT